MSCCFDGFDGRLLHGLALEHAPSTAHRECGAAEAACGGLYSSSARSPSFEWRMSLNETIELRSWVVVEPSLRTLRLSCRRVWCTR